MGPSHENDSHFTFLTIQSVSQSHISYLTVSCSQPVLTSDMSARKRKREKTERRESERESEEDVSFCVTSLLCLQLDTNKLQAKLVRYVQTD